MTILRAKRVLLSNCCCLVQPKTLSKKFSSPSFPFPLFLRSFWTKKKIEMRAKREEIRFLSFFPALVSLGSRSFISPLSSSSLVVFSSVVARGGGAPLLERLLRRAHDITTRPFSARRRRERERTSLLQKSEVFFIPVLKPPTKQDQKRHTREKKKETYRCEQRGGGGRSDGRLGELFRQVGRLDDRLVDRTVRCFDDDDDEDNKRGECEYKNIIVRGGGGFPSISPNLCTREERKNKTKQKDNRNSTRDSITRRSKTRTVWRKPCSR